MDVEAEKERCIEKLATVVRTMDLPGRMQVRLCQIMDFLEDTDDFWAATKYLCTTRAILVVEHGYSDSDELLLKLADIEIDLIEISNYVDEHSPAEQ